MLAAILTNVANHATVLQNVPQHFSLLGDIVAEDAAQFAAGSLYAASAQYIDKRDYIVDCSVNDDDLNTLLDDSFTAYKAGDNDTGNSKMNHTMNGWVRSMAACDSTNDYFKQMKDEANDFMGQSDWDTQMKSNYAANKALIDSDWSNFTN